jgi:Putative Flp pilus-assembly TadE/G-like
MRNRIHHLRRDQRGMSFVFVGLGLTAFLAATTLAIDVGMFMNARVQAQNSADAGALSGVTALVFNDYNNRSSGGPAVQSAMSSAKANKIIFKEPAITPADVTFPLSPDGLPNRVKVDVFRTKERGNAVLTLMGSMFGVQSVDIAATATAEASPANAMTCVKPFMIPDKWEEHQTPDWDPNDTYDRYDNKGKLIANPDVYIPARNCLGCKDNTAYTGYSNSKDKGMLLVLRAGTGNNINPSFYYSWKMPDDIGGNFYRDNIANCNQSKMKWFDLITQEPGDMSGPTIQGITDLIAKDPSAYWESGASGGCNCVKGSKYQGQSPRVFPIPLYDPEYYALGKANGRDADFRIANFLGFFADHVSGNQIYGYVTMITGVVDTSTSTVPGGLFPVDIRLVQ